MRIADTGIGALGLTAVHYSSEDDYIIKSIAVSDDQDRIPVLPKLLEYSWYDFSKFDSDDVTAELNIGEGFSVVKIAIPSGYDMVSLYSGSKVAYRLIPSAREKAFNMVAALYSFSDDFDKSVDPGLLVHLNPEIHAHEDQIASNSQQLTMGFLIGSNYITNITNRKNAVISGTTMMVEDGCKYWLGNFDDTQYN